MKFNAVSPYDDRFQDELNKIYPAITDDLSLVGSLPEEIGRKATAAALGCACEAQNMRNITLGREALLEFPRSWLLARIEVIAEETLNLTDEWEYRRFVELCLLLDDELSRRQIAKGLASPNPEIREAARDYSERKSK